MQSYLLGCPNIFFGYRTRENVLLGTEMVAINDLPMVYKPYDPPFDPGAALQTIHDTLDLAIRVMKPAVENHDDLTHGVWRMRVTSDRRIEIRQLSPIEVQTMNFTDQAGENRIGLVTERLVNLMRAG